jgi:hypothetical protein
MGPEVHVGDITYIRTWEGSSVIPASKSTSRPPTRPGSTKSSGGSLLSPKNKSSAELTAALDNLKTPSASTSRPTTRVHHHSRGSRPLTRSSPTSLVFVHELPVHHTRRSSCNGR